MKNKKNNKLFLIPIAILIILTSVILYTVFNPNVSKDGVKLNLFEQRWLENNRKTVINVLIPNRIPLYSNEGKGIIFSFLTYFENETGLEFNKTAYNIGENGVAKGNRFRIVRNNEKLKDTDLLFYSDNYVVVSRKNQKKIPIDSLNTNIGVLDVDFNVVTSYLSKNKCTFTRLENIESLVRAFESDEVSYIIVPKTLYLNMIVEMDYHVVNTLNDLTLRYVLTLENNNNRFNDIVKKYYNVWAKSQLASDYHGELFNLYTSIKKIDDKSKTDFKSKRYIYGYVESIPYEMSSDGDINGLSSEYINAFSIFSGIEFNFKKYKSVSDLNAALEAGKVDVAFNYYALNAANTYRATDIIYSDYVILSKDKTVIIDTIRSLNGTSIYALKDTKITSYIKNNGRFNVQEVDKVSSLEGKDLVLLDYNAYLYYVDTYFKNYTIAYKNITDNNYTYIINKSSDNNLFYNIFNYYLSTLNHEQYKMVGLNKVLTKSLNLDLSLLWLYVILVPIFIVIIILVLGKRKKIVKMRTDIKLKYIDPLTSLKNRYYLNSNIEKWEENNIYPQALVVINLNNLKDVNDAYGHEGGDQLIKTAANILINNQMEKTDIVRTDGNEFIIYMVGYDESAVIAYVRKLYRLLKDLPYEYGASLGYSMIEDDIKTIEDAINEAILDMITNRETKRNSEV
ncbi:MAG: GGDEF domain-containing protein [Bacilli bacterium]|nr:GGDEF domain-containing protein [Bacilli bacterium]